MGKYTDVVRGLPRAEAEDQSFQQRVDQIKPEFPNRKPAALAKEYRALRLDREALDAQLAALNARLTAVEQLLWDSYEQDGLSSVKLDDGSSVSVQPEPAAQVQDRDALRAWAVANGMERALTLPWQTVNAVTKQRLLDGDPLPDGVAATVRTKTVLRK